jgi:hypothetical protein
MLQINPSSASTDARPPQKKGKGAATGEASAQAFEVLMAAMDPAAAAQVTLSPEAQLQAMVSGSEAEALAMRQINAERAQLTQNADASTKAGQVIAGLQPWKSEWVFRGDEPRDLQPLLKGGAKDSTNPLDPRAGRGEAGAEARLQALQGLEAELGSIEKSIAGIEARALGESARQSGPSVASAESLRQEAARLGLSPGEAALTARVSGASPEGGAVTRNQGMNGATGGLSGAEFMQTLQGVRTGSDRSAGDQSGFGGQERQPGEGMPGRAAARGRLGAERPRLDESLTAAPRESAFGQNLVAGNGTVPASNLGAVTAGAAEVAGHVVKGTMSRDRLSSESLAGISTQLGSLNARGGGEMRIRLNPDHLGELHVKVSTDGQRVGLSIQASDPAAKQVLEESLGYLRDSLASQSLTLGKVDVSVQAPGSSANAGNGFDGSGENSGAKQWDAQQSGQERGQRAAWDRAEEGVPGRPRSMVPPSGLFATATGGARRATAGGYGAASMGSGRIDVMA